MKHFLPLMILLLFFSRCFAGEFYIAKNGNDANPGTKAEPFATLQAARNTIRRLKKTQGLDANGVTVWLRAGTYPISKTFELTKEDSGTKCSPIVYRAFKNEKVRLTGGREISVDAFKPLTDPNVRERIIEKSARSKVLQVNLLEHGIKAGEIGKLERFGFGYKKPAPTELFFDDKPMTMARWPNKGYAKIDKVIRSGSRPRDFMPDVNPDGKKSGPTYIPGIFRYKGNRPQKWTKAREVWLHGYWAYDWADDCMPISYIDTDKHEITLSAPHFYGIKGVLGQGERYYAINLLEELDLPGEYYLDSYTGTVYFYPPADSSGKSIIVSLLAEPFIKMKNVSYVTFQGLIMEACRDLAVSIDGGKENLIAGCTVRNTGGWAIKITGGSKHAVVGCDIYNVGLGGISLTGGNQRTLTAAEHKAVNNHIHHFSRRAKTYQFAIAVNGVGNHVSNNLIHHSPHSALDYRGNYNIIELNEIHHVCEQADDSGAINSDRDYSIRGNIIRYNFFHHITGIRPDSLWMGAHIIYLDSCTSGDSFIGNIFYKGSREIITINGGRDVTVKNNIFAEVGHPVAVTSVGIKSHRSAAVSAYQTMVNKIERTKPPWSIAFPGLAGYPDDIDKLAIPYGNVIVDNIFYQTKDIRISFDANIPRDIVKIENNYIVAKDPFVDISSLNLQLKNDSIALEKIPNIKKIPFEKIGLYKDEYRLTLPYERKVEN